MSVQILTTISIYAVPTLGPGIVSAVAIPATWIGHQVSMVFSAALVASLLAGGLLERIGPTRTLQIALLLAAIGLAVTAIGNPVALFVGAIVLGLGYPLPSPAGADLLNRLTPDGRRNLVFSAKQMAIPAGSMLAGLTLPALASWIGWRGTVLASGATFILLAFLLQGLRGRLDGGPYRNPQSRRPLSFRPWAVLSDWSIRALTVVGLIYSMVQIGVGAYVVTLLVVDHGWSLVAAGTAAALLQACGVAGRLFWGLLADRVRNGFGVMAVVGLLMPVFSALLALSPQGSVNILYIALGGLGLTAVGWNGVFMAEVARRARPGEVMSTTASVLSMVFVGMIAGPLLLGLAAQFSGSFSLGLLCLSAIAPVGAVALIVARTVDRT